MTDYLQINFGDQELWLLKEKSIWWPKHQTLIVSDLHFGKGVSFSPYGSHLPPYDIDETLQRLSFLIKKYPPRKIICLGDNFHRANSYFQFQSVEKKFLDQLIFSIEDWCWIYGNHDKELPKCLRGNKYPFIAIDTLEFHHDIPNHSNKKPIIIGHFHPKHKINLKGLSISKPCFAWNNSTLIMPSFGTYTGGLNVKNPAIIKTLGSTFSIALTDINPFHQQIDG